MNPQPDHYIAKVGKNLPRGQIIGGHVPEDEDEDIDVQPEKIISETRTMVHFITTSAHRLVTSPGYEVTCMIDSSKPSDHEWSPSFEKVCDILKDMEEAHPSMTRMTIRWEKL